jgi:hypothetical protein
LKANYIGIVGVIIAFISLALPWWTASYSISYLGVGTTFTSNWYLYNAGTYGTGMNLWYDWVALLLVVLAGILGLAGSIMQNGKKILIGGGLLGVLAIIIFPVGLQNDLSTNKAPYGLFSNTSVSALGYSYSTYLSFGFWLALVSAIIMLIAAMRTTKTSPTPSPVPQNPAS